MTTTYAESQLAASRTTGIATQTLNTVAHIAGSEIDNSANLDELLDLDITITLAATAVAGDPISTYIIYALDGTNYELGVPSTNDGTEAYNVTDKPNPNPAALVDAHGVLAVTTAQKWTIRDIPLLPYKFKIVIVNGTTKTCTSLLTVLARGKHYQSIG